MEDRSGERVMNKNDQFAFVYNHHYKSSILKQGIIGDIEFYTDHLISEKEFRLYIDREEFIYEFDQKSVTEKGIDAYLGHILKISKEDYQEIVLEKENSTKKAKKGVADKVINNPGSVRYEDLQAYLNEKGSYRLKK
jgi:hypothetical protein